jgi:hypothetical protein
MTHALVYPRAILTLVRDIPQHQIPNGALKVCPQSQLGLALYLPSAAELSSLAEPSIHLTV